MTAPVLSPNRMLVGYNNYFVHSRVSSITLNNISAATGSHQDNLLYEDPHLQFVSTTPSGGNPEIIFSLSVITTTDVFMSGIFNWTGMHQWDQIEIAAGASSTGPWTEFVTVNLKPSLPANASQGFIIRHQAGIIAQHFRWRFIVPPTRPALRIGNIVMFKSWEVDMNPDTGGIRRTRQRQPRGRRSLGGGLHVARSTPPPDMGAQFLWSRMDDTTLAKLVDIDTAFPDTFVGIVPPNQTGRELPLGLQHFLGRSLNVDATALEGADEFNHASRVVWTLEGAI